MLSKRIGKSDFSLVTGEITTDSYEETIKKLTLVLPGKFIQIAPLRLIAGPNHIWFVLEHALSAFEQGSAFTKKPELEFLARLVADKQLNKALEKCSFKKGEPLCLLIESKNLGEIKKIKKELGFVEKKFGFGEEKGLMDFFGIEKTELSALKDVENPLEELVIERCAFTSLER